MAEHYENYYKEDIKLPFKYKNPDGSYVQAIDPKTGKSFDKIDRLTPDEVRRMKGMGYIVEAVEPKPFNSHIELSQTKHDKDLTD